MSNPPSVTNNAPTTPTAAESSNLRRMRKKELIRQYVSQDGTTPAQSSHLNAFLHFPYSYALVYANEEYLLAGSNDLSQVIGSTNVGTLPSSSNLGGQFPLPAAGSWQVVEEEVKVTTTSPYPKPSLRWVRHWVPLLGTTMNPPLSRERRNLQMQPVGDPLSTAAGADKTMETELGKRK